FNSTVVKIDQIISCSYPLILNGLPVAPIIHGGLRRLHEGKRPCRYNIVCRRRSFVASRRHQFFKNVHSKRGSRWRHPTRTGDTSPEEARNTRLRRRLGPQETIDGSRQGIEKTMLRPSVRDVMLAAVPTLRAFAISLSGNADRADDLVQETLLRATANIDSFQPGTNMLAWLFTILRNQFRSEYRKRRREVEDADGSYLDGLTSAPSNTTA